VDGLYQPGEAKAQRGHEVAFLYSAGGTLSNQINKQQIGAILGWTTQQKKSGSVNKAPSTFLSALRRGDRRVGLIRVERNLKVGGMALMFVLAVRETFLSGQVEVRHKVRLGLRRCLYRSDEAIK
jgi:hypothetical protein